MRIGRYTVAHYASFMRQVAAIKQLDDRPFSFTGFVARWLHWHDHPVPARSRPREGTGALGPEPAVPVGDEAHDRCERPPAQLDLVDVGVEKVDERTNLSEIDRVSATN